MQEVWRWWHAPCWGAVWGEGWLKSPSGWKNFFSNRGEADYFVDDVTVLDKDFANVSKRFAGADRGRVIDTVYVVIDKNELKKHINN